MEHEYQVLAHLQENEKTTQRKISSRTGLSLGAVNLLLKKMVRKGLIKVEKLNTRTVRYILTPQGLKEKTKLTYQFVRNSYQQILNINNAVETLLAEEELNGEPEQIILFGPADEVEQILRNTLLGLNINPKTRRPEADNFNPEPQQLILTWRYEDEETLTGNSRVFNIMKMI
jgi:DNA-binding MarR family transcriptional regulator